VSCSFRPSIDVADIGIAETVGISYEALDAEVRYVDVKGLLTMDNEIIEMYSAKLQQLVDAIATDTRDIDNAVLDLRYYQEDVPKIPDMISFD
jgi:hypothetical protein